MEDHSRDEPDSVNANETDSLHSDAKKTSEVSDDESTEYNKGDEDREELEKTPSEEPVSGFRSFVRNDCSEPKEKIRRRLMLDAVMITPPKINRLPSEDENSASTSQASVANVMVNTKALPKEARTYELEKFQKNYLIIFNQESIDGFEPRLGTEQDVEALTNTFKNYGFDVVEHKDCTKEMIVEVLETFRTTNFTEYGCVGVVVLTHGSFSGTLRAKDQVYNETDIIKYFRVYDKPTLITKPKLLIIQACRGTRCQPGVTVQRVGNLKKDLNEEVEPYTLPVMSDMLVVHSSYIGEVSTRDEVHGSWFIQTLCSKINEMSPSHDLESILTEVKREVAADRQWEDFNRATSETDTYKQMPTVTSTLIRKLYLKKFGDESLPTTFVDAPSPATLSEPVLPTTTTPLLCHFGPCSCFLDHFEYIKKCLKLFTEENPIDGIASSYLDISSRFENEDSFNAAKESMAKAMCQYLNDNAKHREFFKYLYFYKHGSQ